MNAGILNITNGDCFNSYFVSRFGGQAVPFCEAMMDGDTVQEIYSQAFIELRAGELNVSAAQYRAKMQAYDALKEHDYDEIHLWFGKDTFCQVNLLTLLAYLEQIGFDGKVWLNFIDDETFDVIESDIAVKLGAYKKLYAEVLIEKRNPCEAGVLNPEAIDGYFDYHSDDGWLARLVKAHAGEDKMSLVRLLIENSKAYGLSDVQAEKLIQTHLK